MVVKKFNNNDRIRIQDSTPATAFVAVAFFVLVSYFVIEHYFLAVEYYAQDPPYFLILIGGFLGFLLVLNFLKKKEPERRNSLLFAGIISFGFCLATYSVVPRLNIITDTRGLHDYRYILCEDHLWISEEENLPQLDMYSDCDRWWKQFQPGDSYLFTLRHGGLGIWQVNMSKIYEEQKKFYGCDGFFSCIFDALVKSNTNV